MVYKLPKKFKKELDEIIWEHTFNEVCKIEFNKMIKKLMDDPLIKKILKEVKKVKPYVEIEIVEVGKNKPEVKIADRNDKNWGYISNENLEKLIDTAKEKLKKRANRQKGNWVNGENLDAIKFPCYCSYFDCGDERRYGEIDIVFFNGNKRFRLRELKQSKIEEVIYCVYHRDSLKSLIEDYNIHILKGKIIIYEEEK